VLRHVLGQTYNGVITSNDHSAYASHHKDGIRQLCWAAIIRKLKALKEDRSSSQPVALPDMFWRI